MCMIYCLCFPITLFIYNFTINGNIVRPNYLPRPPLHQRPSSLCVSYLHKMLPSSDKCMSVGVVYNQLRNGIVCAISTAYKMIHATRKTMIMIK